MSSDEFIASRLDTGIRRVTLQRPARKNALTMPMFATLAGILEEANSDPAVATVLLCGAGGAFTAGHDLDALAEWPQNQGDPVPAFLHALARLQKPLVIAVDGAAVGIGATMLLHADWVCCTPEAHLRMPFVDLGFGPEAASSELLPRAVGLLRAKRLLLTGEAFSGQQAFDWGLVTELATREKLLDLATDRARTLAAKPAAVVAEIKRLLAVPSADLEQRIDDEVAFINRCLVDKPPRSEP